MPDVIVVGAGIVGASVAFSAARLGAAVTVVDKALPGSGATAESFAWIGASGIGAGPAAALRRAATREYRRLEAEVPGVRVRWTGSLSWSGTTAADAALPDPAEQRLVTAAEVAGIEPGLRRPPARAVHVPGDGAVDPVAVTEALVQAARGRGAEVRVGTAVTAVRRASGRVVGVDTSAGALPADTVVLATGADVPVLCAPLGADVPVTPSPALLVRFTAPRAVVRTLVAAPEVEVRHAADGTLLAAVGYDGEVTHADLARVGRRTLDRVTSAFSGADGVRVLSVRIGWRPMPADGEPVVGPLPGAGGLYLAVMHSAVTLAPVVGRLAAAEIVTAVDEADLRGCRPARFTRALTRPGGGGPGRAG
ncbi:NAD(P)/FAD-dependent oxidoreductase [Geodermatophilus sp. SYSU D00700]